MIRGSHNSDAPLEDKWEPPLEENGESSLEDEGRTTKEANFPNGGTSEQCPICHGSGRRNGNLVREDNQISSGTSRSNNERQTNLENGCPMSLRIFSEIGKGSNGTSVFDGTYGEWDGEKRPVAVKRLLLGHHRLSNEIPHLIVSDNHPNICRYFTARRTQHFVYLALELCDFSLDDLIQAHLDSSNEPVFPREDDIKLRSVRKAMQDRELWRPDRHPSPLLLKLMRDVVSGLIHLHNLGIIHRDLNPRNVLITKDPSLCAKLSDMGISKRLLQDKSSLGCPASGSGTSGWRAPEQLLGDGSQTRQMDMFPLGCLLYFCLTKGGHPFGRDRARDFNIEENIMDLSPVKFIPEGHDLISRLLNRIPKMRPKAWEVRCHPLFWDSARRLSFIWSFSNRLESENWVNSRLLKKLERSAPVVFGKSWIGKMDKAFMGLLEEHRAYNGHSVQDLLRAERNAFSHSVKPPINVQEIIPSFPENLEAYFTERFRSLLMESYKVAFQFCKGDEWFKNFFSENELSDVLTP